MSRVHLCQGCARPVEGRLHCEPCARRAFAKLRAELDAHAVTARLMGAELDALRAELGEAERRPAREGGA